MVSLLSQQEPDAELQAAFRRHLPQRLRTLLRRARTQCRAGWDCNVLRSLHDEIAQLAGTCGRYGMLEAGERLLALESALAPAVAAHEVPDAAANARIDALLDSLRPHLQQVSPGPGLPAWMDDVILAVAKAPFPRCEVPAANYWLQLGLHEEDGMSIDRDADGTLARGDRGDVAAAIATEAATIQPARAALPEHPRGPRVRIVDDDEPLVNELMVRLDQQGCDVSLVERLEDLIEQLRGAPPDLAILVADAGMSLEQLANALREARRDPAHHVRLLVLLREANAELRLRALRAGADRCIALPTAAGDAVAAAFELATVDQELPYRVLIVDDDAPQALFAQAILRHAGMETRVLGQSLPVLEELDRFQPDLLLLDLNMPDCDGFELTALIREREDYVNTPIVFLSGDQDEDRQFAALDAGGDDFLVKPIRPAHLVAAVTNRVRRARAAASRTRRLRRRNPATGLHERAQLLDALSEHLAACAGDTAPGGLLLVELQNAAALRDRIGAADFDQLLNQVGEFVVRHVRVDTMTARHGEAAFLIFAPTRNERELFTLATELAAAVGDERFGVHASAVRLALAACGFDATASESAAALAAVEQALQVARGQPNGIAMYSSLDPDANAIAQHIESALANGSFDLAFQPILPIRGAAGPHYQALLRLRHGGHEFRAAELVPAAIRAGSIAALDAWVVERCIEILSQRRYQGEPVRLFASQSLEGWKDAARRDLLAARLAAAAGAADALVLEFRCEEVRANAGAWAELGAELKQAGVRLSLAGIDAEAAAMSLIEHPPLDYLKLAPALGDADLATIVATAHSHHLRVIAPCIETVARAEQLRVASVDLLQGNYFQPPVAALDHAFPGGEA